MHIESGAIAYAHAQAFCAVMHKLVQLLRPEGDDTRLSEASHQQNGAQKARHNEAERETVSLNVWFSFACVSV